MFRACLRHRLQAVWILRKGNAIQLEEQYLGHVNRVLDSQVGEQKGTFRITNENHEATLAAALMLYIAHTQTNTAHISY